MKERGSENSFHLGLKGLILPLVSKMNFLTKLDSISQQRWIDPLADQLQAIVKKVLKRGRLANILHGTWLGHPLHPALTDVPLGAWSFVAVADVGTMVCDSAGARRAADLAIGVGLLGAAGSAVSGLADWQYLEGSPRRVGTAHAILNIAATGLYTLALASRVTGNRGQGRALAFAGFGVVSLAAYLGGELVYRHSIGTLRHADHDPPEAFVPVLSDDQLPEGKLIRVIAEGVPVLLAREADQIFAITDTCTHLGCSLAEGEYGEGSVTCPCHGSRFMVADGRVVDGPATFPQQRLEVRVRKGEIEVRAPREV